MRFILPITFLLASFSTFAQLEKKFQKLLDYEYSVLEASDDYQWRPEGDVHYYESWTLKGDTTGASNNTEFLLFRDEIVNEKGELFKIFRKNWVTFAEWQNFVQWTTDSTILEKVYLNTNNDIDEYLIGEMLVHPEVYYDSVNLVWTEFDPSQPFINRGLFNLSWRMNGIKDWQIIPLISDMYLRPNERFYRQKIYDNRKLNYYMRRMTKEEWYQDAPGLVNVSPDPDIFARKSEYPFDIYYTLSKYLTDSPYNSGEVQGVLGTQIMAFLHYTELQLQRDLNEAELPYRVRVTLPTQKEIDDGCGCEDKRPTSETVSQDMTDHWKITNEDYKEFLSWIEDSIVKSAVYDSLSMNSKGELEELVGDMLEHVDIYYDEVNQNWTEFQPSRPYINRTLFFFARGNKWKKKIDESLYAEKIKHLYDDQGFVLSKYVYKYYWKDLKTRSEMGEFEWELDEEVVDGVTYGSYVLKDPEVGKGINCTSGVRMHEDYSKFFVEEKVSVYPADENYDFDSESKALIQGLAYEQALAYYHWKYQLMTPHGKKDIWAFYDLVPSQEEFKKVQNGETVVAGPYTIEFPDPLFRYVVHVYPR